MQNDLPVTGIDISAPSTKVTVKSPAYNINDFYAKLHKVIGTGTLISAFVVLGVLVFSYQVVIFFGFKDYGKVQTLIIIFAAAMLALPTEKFTGIAFDAIGGEMTGLLVKNCTPSSSAKLLDSE